MSKKLISREKWKGHLSARQLAELKKYHSRNNISGAVEVRKGSKHYHNLYVPGRFSLRENPNEVIFFLNEIELLGKQSSLHLNFDNVQLITPEAIAALIATISKATLASTAIRGNVPVCASCKQILEESGFFDHVKFRRSLLGVSRGRIQRRQSKKVESVVALELITTSTQQIGKAHSEASYRILIEGMGNTLDHAKAAAVASTIFNGHVGSRNRALEHDSETWWAMAYADSSKGCVCFVFLDTGVGIFKSVKIKKLRKLFKVLRLESDTELMRELLLGELGSRTGLAYRGKGLPAIRELNDLGEVKELTLITNRVIADISANSYKQLDYTFHGTLLYWEI